MGFEYLIGFAIGCVATGIVSLIIRLIREASGTLRIDHSNPEKDVYRIEIDNLDTLNKKSRVNLKIDHNANLSQK